MNDPIKDFVEKNRAEFDHLEAPVLKLDQLKPRFQAAPELRKKSFLITNGSKWLVAASVLVTVTCLWLFFFNDTATKPSTQLAQQQPVKEATKQTDTAESAKTPDLVATTKTNTVAFASSGKTASKQPKVSAATQDLYAGLQDSTSASTRLMAILEMEKTGRVDNRVMDMLALTLNNDGNTNVRLAALSLMQKYSDDGHVSALLVSSLNKQNDPIVQLGLVSLLGKKKNLKIDDKLKSLADGPDTFAAVRDEAYSILLNQNKL